MTTMNLLPVDRINCAIHGVELGLDESGEASSITAAIDIDGQTYWIDSAELLEDKPDHSATTAELPVYGDDAAMLADYCNLLDTKKVINEKLAEINRQLAAVKARLIAEHESRGFDVIGSAKIKVMFKDKLRPRVDPEKWVDVWNWAVSTKNTHVLFKRLCAARVVELATEGEAMPEGITLDPYVDVTYRRK